MKHLSQTQCGAVVGGAGRIAIGEPDPSRRNDPPQTVPVGGPLPPDYNPGPFGQFSPLPTTACPTAPVVPMA